MTSVVGRVMSSRCWALVMGLIVRTFFPSSRCWALEMSSVVGCELFTVVALLGSGDGFDCEDFSPSSRCWALEMSSIVGIFDRRRAVGSGAGFFLLLVSVRFEWTNVLLCRRTKIDSRIG
jgi:hypothetical protein